MYDAAITALIAEFRKSYTSYPIWVDAVPEGKEKLRPYILIQEVSGTIDRVFRGTALTGFTYQEHVEIQTTIVDEYAGDSRPVKNVLKKLVDTLDNVSNLSTTDNDLKILRFWRKNTFNTPLVLDKHIAVIQRWDMTVQRTGS